jgi:casein kinase I family protein HRR25
MPFKDGQCPRGTIKYVSLNTHLGIEQSRRDDIETAGYVLV